MTNYINKKQALVKKLSSYILVNSTAGQILARAGVKNLSKNELAEADEFVKNINMSAEYILNEGIVPRSNANLILLIDKFLNKENEPRVFKGIGTGQIVNALKEDA